MTVAELTTAGVTSQEVVAWRLEQLIDAGYTLEEATAIAYCRDVDLHQAVDLVAGGCSHQLALAILL